VVGDGLLEGTSAVLGEGLLEGASAVLGDGLMAVDNFVLLTMTSVLLAGAADVVVAVLWYMAFVVLVTADEVVRNETGM
jgi:hypothetical protein